MDDTAKSGHYKSTKLIYFVLLDVVESDRCYFQKLVIRIGEELPVLGKFRFQRGRFPLVLVRIWASVSKALSMVRSRTPQLQATEIDEDRSAVLRPESQPALVPF